VSGLGCSITSVFFRLTVRPNRLATSWNRSKSCCASFSECATSAQSSAYRRSLITADRVFVRAWSLRRLNTLPSGRKWKWVGMLCWCGGWTHSLTYLHTPIWSEVETVIPLHWQIFIGHRPKKYRTSNENIGFYRTHVCFSIQPVYQCNAWYLRSWTYKLHGFHIWQWSFVDYCSSSLRAAKYKKNVCVCVCVNQTKKIMELS